jgi:hypothetical protein
MIARQSNAASVGGLLPRAIAHHHDGLPVPIEVRPHVGAALAAHAEQTNLGSRMPDNQNSLCVEAKERKCNASLTEMEGGALPGNLLRSSLLARATNGNC